jgi:chromate transporter
MDEAPKSIANPPPLDGPAPKHVPVLALVRYFLRLGASGFGGPAALCGQMERELVGEKGWLTRTEMREAIAVSQSLPGPLAIQVGIFAAYLRGGVAGALAGGWAFILPNFVIVALLGALYVHFGDLPWMTSVFYGVAPVVIALIVHSCWRLAKMGVEDRLQWAIAADAFLITVVLKAEVALVFVGAGVLGVLWYGSLMRKPQAVAGVAAVPAVAGAPHPGSAGVIGKLILFFLKAGSLTFGSGLVIVPFLEKGLVQETGWITQRDFLIAVAVGMLSPGPVVITATFVGFVVAGFWGSLASTVAIFTPSFVFILVAAPLLKRYRANPNVQGFIKGVYGAAIGTIFGAAVLLGRIAIGDVLTALVGLAALILLFRTKIPNPALVATAAMIGLAAYPALKPAWVMLK